MKKLIPLFVGMVVFCCAPVMAGNHDDSDKIRALETKVERLEKSQRKLLASVEAIRAELGRRPAPGKQLPEESLSRVIEALSLIVEQRHWREDQLALERALEQRYDLDKDEDPFAFRSKRLQELLEEKHLTREEFDILVDELEDSLKALKKHYYHH